MSQPTALYFYTGEQPSADVSIQPFFVLDSEAAKQRG